MDPEQSRSTDTATVAPLPRSSWRAALRLLRHVWLLCECIPGLLLNREDRALFFEMRGFVLGLPERLKAPLAEVMAELAGNDPGLRPRPPLEHRVRRLADAAVLLDFGSPLGICLRRSLTRYRFLRRSGLPVAIHFGARFTGGKSDRSIAGHAWLTLDGQPYHEADADWRGFTAMLSFPPDSPSPADESP